MTGVNHKLRHPY